MTAITMLTAPIIVGPPIWVYYGWNEPFMPFGQPSRHGRRVKMWKPRPSRKTTGGLRTQPLSVRVRRLLGWPVFWAGLAMPAIICFMYAYGGTAGIAPLDGVKMFLTAWAFIVVGKAWRQGRVADPKQPGFAGL